MGITGPFLQWNHRVGKDEQSLWTLVILFSFDTSIWQLVLASSKTKIAPLGFYGQFSRSLYNFFEFPEEPCTCYEFVDGSPEDLASAPSGDCEEKSVIALFVHPLLLYKQHGGFLNDYAPLKPRKVSVSLPKDKCVWTARRVWWKSSTSSGLAALDGKDAGVCQRKRRLDRHKQDSVFQRI